MINIYTDGSHSKKRCGWGFIAIENNGQKYSNNGIALTGTNQRMELLAVVQALDWWAAEHNASYDDVTIHTDSAYVYNCWADKWFVNWISNGWKNTKGIDVANQDLWKLLIPFFTNPHVFFNKVKGHSGHSYNELADKLATGSITSIDELKIEEKNDKINIELSEILLDYSMKKFSVDETIRRIRKACNCG